MIAAEERRVAANAATGEVVTPDGRQVPVTQIKAERETKALGALSRVRNAVRNFLRPAQKRTIANAMNPYREAKA